MNSACAALLQHSSLFPQLEDRDSNSFDGGDDSFDTYDLTEFTGDYFGYYDEQDLEWPDDNHEVAELPLESDSEEEEGHDAELEHGWECPAVIPVLQDIDDEESDTPFRPHLAEQQEVQELLGRQPIIEKFPQHRAGTLIHLFGTTVFGSYNNVLQGTDNVWAPFVSRINYEVAKWAKLCGSGSTAFSELLAIEGLHDALGLSY
ncbi:hypothetical protein BDR07DRAFT_1480545 [Suillus spraguei]|nr:hypothetical protein BDR07DRAFT_1480545 [Suillus spraguei]